MRTTSAIGVPPDLRAQAFGDGVGKLSDFGSEMLRGRGKLTANSSATRPGRLVRTTIRSPRRTASRTLCVTKTIVTPVSRQMRSSFVVEQVAGHRVERPERLVHEQDVRVLRESPGDRNTLAHAAR